MRAVNLEPEEKNPNERPFKIEDLIDDDVWDEIDIGVSKIRRKSSASALYEKYTYYVLKAFPDKRDLLRLDDKAWEIMLPKAIRYITGEPIIEGQEPGRTPYHIDQFLEVGRALVLVDPDRFLGEVRSACPDLTKAFSEGYNVIKNNTDDPVVGMSPSVTSMMAEYLANWKLLDPAVVETLVDDELWANMKAQLEFFSRKDTILEEHAWSEWLILASAMRILRPGQFEADQILDPSSVRSIWEDLLAQREKNLSEPEQAQWVMLVSIIESAANLMLITAGEVTISAPGKLYVGDKKRIENKQSLPKRKTI